MRRARFKSQDDAFYHIITRVAGSPDWFPFQDNPEAAAKLIEIIRHYALAFCCQIVCFQIMGNHYHFIVFIEKFCRLSGEELMRRARLLHGPRADILTATWSDEAWEKFNRKLFDLSALMQMINGEYAKWFNQRHNRRGHLWADRFKNPELLDLQALSECLLYVELNAVRAGLVERPEEWRYGSAWCRWHGEDQDLMPLNTIFSNIETAKVFELYRALLYFRGDIDDCPPPPAVRLQPRGLFRRRRRFFTHGGAIGSHTNALERLNSHQTRGEHRLRKNPIAQLDGLLFTVCYLRSPSG